MEKAGIISQLQQDILVLQGFRPASNSYGDLGLGLLKEAMPNGSFPFGAVHEFLNEGMETAAASSGFIAGLLSPLMANDGISVWISASRTLFPPALKMFGIQPDRFIFIDIQKDKDVPWAMEEALKCAALTAVIGEMKEISFTMSRRLQLAVEQSHVTGFVIRNSPKVQNPTACVSRWRITPIQSKTMDDLPGIGFPVWKVELIRMRNGKTGIWEINWIEGKFLILPWRDASIGKSHPSRDVLPDKKFSVGLSSPESSSFKKISLIEGWTKRDVLSSKERTG